MAQWRNQFTGNTHTTKVRDAESALRNAVMAFHAASSSDRREQKAKTVRNLAKRLLSARLRLLKSRLVAAKPVQTESNLESLRRREARTSEKGLDGILVEFGAPDAIT